MARGARGEQLDKRAKISPSRHNLFNARNGDVHRRHQGHQSNVGFALYDNEGTGVGCDKVRSRDADIGTEELFSQTIACKSREIFSGLQGRSVANTLLKSSEIRSRV